ncbi:MAG: hypothetical protein E6Q46_06900 [Flavobacterium sp.]|nr:MAG: hypothetical protein E6Q46_06900 [Flavobacterium sp.]
MNKLIALFLISVFMCANTSIGQLLKIPNLIEHYIEHKNELTTASISFIDFLESHYSKNAENNPEEHQDLPFKTFEIASTVFVLVNNANIQIQPVKAVINTKQKFFYHQSFKSHLINTIWLPPKIA